MTAPDMRAVILVLVLGAIMPATVQAQSTDSATCSLTTAPTLDTVHIEAYGLPTHQPITLEVKDAFNILVQEYDLGILSSGTYSADLPKVSGLALYSFETTHGERYFANCLITT